MNGITINIDPVIVQLGGFALRWYSLAFAGGIALAVWLTLREAKRVGLNTDKVTNVALWAVVGGLVGARLFHVVDRLDYYLDNPQLILAIHRGGMAIWGGLITGGLAATIAARKERLPALKLADATVLGLLAGQMLGRVGCVINGDAYGGPTGMPWGLVYVNPAAMIPDALRSIPTHPYPVYEVIWNLALLGVLLFLRKRQLPVGVLFSLYVAGYAIGRLALTFVRQEALWFWGLQEAQVVALVMFALALAAVVYLLRARPIVAATRRRRPAARRSA